MKRKIIAFLACTIVFASASYAQSSQQKQDMVRHFFQPPFSIPVCSYNGGQDTLIRQGGLSLITIRYNERLDLLSQKFCFSGLLDSDYDPCSKRCNEISIRFIGIKGTQSISYSEACSALEKYYRPLTAREMVYMADRLKELLQLNPVAMSESLYAMCDAGTYFEKDAPLPRPITDYLFGFKIDQGTIAYLFERKDLLQKGDFIVCVER